MLARCWVCSVCYSWRGAASRPSSRVAEWHREQRARMRSLGFTTFTSTSSAPSRSRRSASSANFGSELADAVRLRDSPGCCPGAEVRAACAADGASSAAWVAISPAPRQGLRLRGRRCARYSPTSPGTGELLMGGVIVAVVLFTCRCALAGVPDRIKAPLRGDAKWSGNDEERSVLPGRQTHPPLRRPGGEPGHQLDTRAPGDPLMLLG